MKPVRITPYCQGRIEARNLDRKLVEDTVHSPEQILPDDDDPKRRICQSRFIDSKGRPKLLRVVVEEMEDEMIVITVYPASQIERYWKQPP